jgi:riboflavin kinase/FMN adenylyltransferase
MHNRGTVHRFGLPPHLTGTVVTVGTFDGVHLGHWNVLSRLTRRATEVGLPSVLLTFDPHPLEIVNPSVAPALLTAGDEKLELLAESGLDYAVVLPFTRELSAFSADAFVETVLRGGLRMVELLIGHDHGFGRGRAGDVATLEALGVRDGFRVEVVPPVLAADGHPISSTSIRRAIAGGDLRRASASLGRLYAIGGRVTTGEGRGRLLGFPTINLPIPSARKLLPPAGVYAVRTQTPVGAYGGMMNLGPRPTFGDDEISAEIHLFDVAANLYRAHVRVEFVDRLRDTRRFESPQALAAQLRDDEALARDALTLLGDSRTL